jgi:GT2 family glycosyltransferase
MIRLSIVIVTWNAKKYVAECLDSLQTCSNDPETEIIVVDNSSTDGTPELVRDSYPRITLIRNEENLGFAKANNVGIRKSTGEYVFLINSDVHVLDGCVEQMMDYLKQDPRIGLLGPKMLGADRNSYRSYMGEPTLWRCFCRALALDVLFPNSRNFGGYLMPYFKRDHIAEVDVLNGWFWATRREALNQVGLLDETFFMYGEDIDWSKRFREAGWKVVYFPKAESIHYGGASSSKAPIRFYIEMQKANYQYWKKHYGRASQLTYLLMNWIEQSARLIGHTFMRFVGKKPSDASFKAKRSMACICWIMGIRYRTGSDAR